MKPETMPVRAKPYAHQQSAFEFALRLFGVTEDGDTLAFKEMFWQRYCDGVAPIQIFIDAGINPETLGRPRINGLAKTLRKNKECGVPFNEGDEPHIGESEKGFDFPIPPKRPASTTISLDEAARLAHKVEYLSQQIEFLKKNYLCGQWRKVEMMLTSTPSARFEVIREMTLRDNNLLNIAWLCEIAGVSRSGYYYWLDAEKKRIEREKQDKQDFNLILEAYKFRGYDKGIRGINMRLLHLKTPVLMNPKKISRLMHKFHLICPVRKANPYRRIGRAMQTNNVAPNLLTESLKRLARGVCF
jgi:hypothetical protein